MEITWTISAGQGQPDVEKLEHYEAIKVDKDANEGQKEFARRFNNMRKKLLESGLMHEK
ncbi:hypothetical protein [Paenibacillus oleatilyticus]|uniref:Uncharacterized protein n=1 Tax=Paenibacillus oleatilyticus TaxID=2594886 RepID=A0ABV4VCG9_9BACL